MHHRIESVLLVLAGLSLLFFLTPSVALTLFASFILSLLLIALLVMRSIAGHGGYRGAFDIVIVLSVVLLVGMLLSMAVFWHGVLSAIMIVLASLLFLLLGAVSWWLGASHACGAPHAPRERHVRASAHVEGREERHTRPRKAFLRRLFRRNLEPIPMMNPAAAEVGKQHDPSFKQGIEPLHEVTPAHLHKLGVYDAEPRKNARG
jgi:hypothetical protein